LVLSVIGQLKRELADKAGARPYIEIVEHRSFLDQ
jgi:hypothetical protein